MTTESEISSEYIQFGARIENAREIIRAGRMDGWLQDQFPAEEVTRILKEFELPEQAGEDLLALVQALDQTLQQTPPRQPKLVRSELKQLRSQLSQLKQMLKTLSVEALDALKDEPRSWLDPETDLWVVEFDNDPTPKFIGEIEKIEERALRDPPIARPGRRLAARGHAIEILDRFLKGFGIQLHAAKLADLSSTLFDDVLLKHGHTMRGDRESAPRPRDATGRIRRKNQSGA